MNIGAKIGYNNMFVSAFADDNFLLSPSVSHLQKLLDICADYACRWKIKFNYKKSKIICFGNSYFKKTFFHMNNLEINSVESFRLYIFKGRPYGGTCWSIDKDIKIIHHEFLNEHISYIVIEYCGMKWLIIGTIYMPFDNNKIDSFCAFETNLALISELINQYKKMKNYKNYNIVRW